MINFTIVLADDEQQILYGMKNGIDWESLGFSVVGTAQNGKEALELIEEYHPDLLISDIKMPFMDGLELSKTIHENYINTKIILFSGWDDFEYARTAISYGVSQYIMKPIDYNEMQKLLTTMHEELEKEYAEKMNRTRLENIYTESIPLLRQQFFTQLLTETLTEDYCTLQMKNLKLNLDYKVFHIITVKIRENDLNDVLSELSIKETIKESLEKITDLYHFGMIDREVFLLCGNKKHDVIWLLLLIVGIILVFTDILLFHDFTNPVYQLLDTMQEFGKGNYKVKAAENGIGELKTLSAHFNIMAEKLQNQMDEIRRNEREKRKMEKKLLQSQINPHFLYNTLDSIIWMIQSGEYKGAEQMVSSLAKFFRISLSQGKDIIPLEKELEHATSYLAIQNIRFKDKFEFSVQADKKLLHYLCPKLSIQPLLENAIYHGMEGVYDDGEITISVYEKDNLIHIDVSDNGLGMPEKVVEYIMHNRVVSSKRGSGIGVRNVDERIKLIYGEQYGVTIESELDEGTTATIIIPKLEETAEINSDESNKTKL